MVDFRKWFPVLAVIAVMMFTAVSASAQTPPPAFSCVANAGVPPVLRAEGLTELTGDILLNCTGGTPAGNNVANPNSPATVPLINFEIFLNTNVTSRLLTGNVSEAILTIDEPTAANQRLCSATPGVPATVLGPAPCIINPNPGGGTGVNYAGAGGAFNVFLGEQSAPNRILWRGIPVDAPGTTGTRVIRITNVRANANQLGVSSSLIPSTISTLISATSSTSVPINNPQQTTGFVIPGMTFSVSGIASGLLQCNSVNSTLFGDPTASFTGNFFTVRFTEGFPSSFKVRVNGTTATTPTTVLPQDTLGANYSTESGFYNPALTGTCQGGKCAGLADTGTRLMARFNNVPAGVQMFVSPTLQGFNTSGGAATRGRAILISTTDATGATGSVGNPISAGANGISPVALSGGSGVAVWEVIDADPVFTERFESAVVGAYRANPAAGLPAVATQATALGSFAPLSTVTTASVSAPIPRFADSSVSRNTILINACSTNLLFPFVTNQAGFDTGIAISNTSLDPFGTAGQSGICTINYYGNTSGGDGPPAHNSEVVGAGKQLLFVLSSGGNLGMTATPNFQGYIIASCKFQYAHGFAFVTDGPIGQARVAEGYLALVMDAAIGTRTGFASETLSH